MELLKTALCLALALVSITYSKPLQPIIIAVNSSKKG
jgi:hypothetical protein